MNRLPERQGKPSPETGRAAVSTGPVPGTRGYAESLGSFLDASRSLSFAEACAAFIPFLPPEPARILDAGSGVGQNAAALAQMGHAVVAVEPLAVFLAAARDTYPHLGVDWQQDSLPGLASLSAPPGSFDFILVEAVWHHLDGDERVAALQRLSGLLGRGGRCALSLRNGPAGVGTHVFPTSVEQTLTQAREFGLTAIFCVEHLPSLLPNKPDVTWARMVLQKSRD